MCSIALWVLKMEREREIVHGGGEGTLVSTLGLPLVLSVSHSILSASLQPHEL